MTKKEMFNFIKSAMSDNADVVAFCDKEIALLEKKALSAKKAPKKPDALIDTVYSVLTSEPQLISDIATKAGISNAKATYRLNSLTKQGKVNRSIVSVHDANSKTRKLVSYTIA